MSRSSRVSEPISQFCAVTGASAKDARRYLEKYKRVEAAIDAFYNDPSTRRTTDGNAPSTSKLNALFDKYKDADGEDITVDGTIQFCEDLGVNPEDIVLLSVAYELKSPQVGRWTKKGWVEGWKNTGCDSIASMQACLPRLRERLGSDPRYFQQVYNYTFDFARSEGQRSLALESAQAFWGLLLPFGLEGGALAYVPSKAADGDGMYPEGWKEDYTDMWFEFLNEKGGKGISKDTWTMFLEFVRTIDSRFETYDMEAAWPSTIDDFVEWGKARLQFGAP